MVAAEHVRCPTFDPSQLVDAVLDGYEPEDLREAWRNTERRKNRHHALLLGAVRSPKGQGARKTAKQTGSVETRHTIARNAMKLKDFTRVVPVPIVVKAFVNGHAVRALLDTGSMADFLSTTTVHQLQLVVDVLAKPLPVQLAVHGSRSSINCCAMVDFACQDIACKHRFDMVNLDDYDMILGTPFMFQHQVAIGLNPVRVSVGCNKPVEVQGQETEVITSAAADLLSGELENLRAELRRDAGDLCQDGAHTELPPLREVNHTIPLINNKLIFSWRPSKCPDALKPLWRAKLTAYLESKQWQMAAGTNTCPMLMIPKPP